MFIYALYEVSNSIHFSALWRSAFRRRSRCRHATPSYTSGRVSCPTCGVASTGEIQKLHLLPIQVLASEHFNYRCVDERDILGYGVHVRHQYSLFIYLEWLVATLVAGVGVRFHELHEVRP